MPFLNRLLYHGFLKICQVRAISEFENKKAVSPCLAARKFVTVSHRGEVYPCEIFLEKIGSLRDSDYNLARIIAGNESKRIRTEIKRSKCYCQWPCAIIYNSLFDISCWKGALKKPLYTTAQFQ